MVRQVSTSNQFRRLDRRVDTTGLKNTGRLHSRCAVPTVPTYVYRKPTSHIPGGGPKPQGCCHSTLRPSSIPQTGSMTRFLADIYIHHIIYIMGILQQANTISPSHILYGIYSVILNFLSLYSVLTHQAAIKLHVVDHSVSQFQRSYPIM